MNILVTVNSAYVKPLLVMLESLFYNNQQEEFHIYLFYRNLKKWELAVLDAFIGRHKCTLLTFYIEDRLFENAPVALYYSKEMYFRLLAHTLLPDSLNKILYLDPDILVLNPIRDLYETDISDYLYAAAYHKNVTATNFNKLRLHPYKINAYYNSGVLLMNLNGLRRETSEREIYGFIEKNKNRMILPDQDILNSLYAARIKRLDELYYNYDARLYPYYKLSYDWNFDMNQVIYHTVILHFCGRNKPWNEGYHGRFLSLYKHYEKQALSHTGYAAEPPPLLGAARLSGGTAVREAPKAKGRG